jgi:hypothetical protein
MIPKITQMEKALRGTDVVFIRGPLFTWPEVYWRGRSGVNTFLGKMQTYFWVPS